MNPSFTFFPTPLNSHRLFSNWIGFSISCKINRTYRDWVNQVDMSILNIHPKRVYCLSNYEIIIIIFRLNKKKEPQTIRSLTQINDIFILFCFYFSWIISYSNIGRIRDLNANWISHHIRYFLLQTYYKVIYNNKVSQT